MKMAPHRHHLATPGSPQIQLEIDNCPQTIGKQKQQKKDVHSAHKTGCPQH